MPAPRAVYVKHYVQASEEAPMLKIEGGCHCGNIEYVFETSIPLERLYLRECQCSFCRKQGAIYTSDPNGNIYINIKDKRNVTKYKFSTKVIEFIFCKRCGVMPYASMSLDQYSYAVINIRTSVIDLKGKEIKTLVNENQQQGFYSADFDAGSLQSGIYFCRLQAGSFTQIKKMILIR